MWLFSRKGLSGFSSNSTAEQVTDRVDGTGLTAIVSEVKCSNDAYTAQFGTDAGDNCEFTSSGKYCYHVPRYNTFIDGISPSSYPSENCGSRDTYLLVSSLDAVVVGSVIGIKLVVKL
ncbi:hypothetical protein POM88_033590 [Heracleum sosnowskyi]|uniref:Uncharacterized protein n=1 Tax=Heracleum sosnowskyi TaxID=360622 RepID=A0AAD8HJK2_9APIA|nr:hypothetical protein POM88_033590 [Heracleum sosnowskyi]